MNGDGHQFRMDLNAGKFDDISTDTPTAAGLSLQHFRNHQEHLQQQQQQQQQHHLHLPQQHQQNRFNSPPTPDYYPSPSPSLYNRSRNLYVSPPSTSSSPANASPPFRYYHHADSPSSNMSDSGEVDDELFDSQPKSCKIKKNANDSAKATTSAKSGKKGGPKKGGSKKSTDACDKVWTNDEVELLLRLWEENESLYKKDDPDYLDSNKRSVIINAMADQLKTTPNEVSKKIRSLQSYYCQQRLKAREPVPSGSAASAKKPIAWIWFERMQFLDTRLESDTTIGNNESLQELRDEFSGDQTSNSKKRSRPDPRSQTNVILERCVTALEKDISAEAARPVNPPVQPTQKTADEVFGELVVLQLKNIEESIDKEDLRLQILMKINDFKRARVGPSA